MNRLDIEYNTERSQIIYPEYGRSIQEMIAHAKTIENDQQRQKTVEAIVGLMATISPTTPNRNMDDFKEKLWNHVFAIANYELEVKPPSSVAIIREEDRPKPEPLGYPASSTRMRHYGSSVHALIQKAIEMPDGVKKEGFVEVIASYMKLAYKTWNKEHYVSDDIVKEDLEILSNGMLELHEGHDSLDKLAAGVGKHDKDRGRQRNRGNNKNRGRSNNRGNGGGNNYRRRKRN
ncbi:MAG: DUF4290 domain-containing protein [Saprospiraceae bacterium]|nr:DUF4290 domain-containing protein [Saprospiraceae bacterium]MCB9343195.1 DUF4290 domain-containing protein [Lewinellaceae bacterium]